MKKIVVSIIVSLAAFNIAFGQKKENDKSKLESTLVKTLDTIYEDDQKYRQQTTKIAEKHGWESEEVKSHWRIVVKKDSMNLIKVKKNLDTRGWLGPDIIGEKGSATLFLVLQHSDLTTQEKYLPMLRQAVKDGNAGAISLALLEDRVALDKGEKQMYGTQIGVNLKTGKYYVRWLHDPDNVNKRRKKNGLNSIEEYVSNWGITWNV